MTTREARYACGIPAGAFADHFPPPAVEVCDERRRPWLPDAGIPREF